jgi:hypothetical protein
MGKHKYAEPSMPGHKLKTLFQKQSMKKGLVESSNDRVPV